MDATQRSATDLVHVRLIILGWQELQPLILGKIAGNATDMGEESAAAAAAAGELKKRPHIVMFNFPAQGRMIPGIALASRLAALGAEVSYVCPEYQLKRLGETKARGGYNDRIRLVGLKAPNSEVLSVPPESLIRIFEGMGLMIELFEEFLRNLPELPACVIVDEVCAEIANVVHRLKLPRYIFSPQSAFAFSAAMYVRRLAADARLPLPHTPDELVQIPGTMPPLRACEFLSPYLDRTPGWMTDFFVAAALRAHDADGVLMNTFEELEPGTLSALRSESELNPNKLRMVPIGPLLPEEQHLSSSSSSSRPEEGLCLDFLDRHPPASVVYVSFGTIKTLTEEEVREMALGLEAAGRPFIWMLRCEAAFIPEGFQPPFGLVLSTWAPQLRILSHPSTGPFVTHFGWNSTLESISCGVPMLGFPGFMDQFMNRMLVESLRVGLSVQNDAVERAAVERGVKEVLGSEEMRQRARGLRDAARRAMRIANHNLTSFVDGLRC